MRRPNSTGRTASVPIDHKLAALVGALVAAWPVAAQTALRAMPLYDFPAIGSTRYGGSNTFASNAGDVNGDGTDDFIVITSESVSGADRVDVYDGATGGTLHTFFHPTGVGYDQAVSGAGDVNNDGLDDLVIGSFDSSGFPLTGSARVYSGGNGALLYTFVSNDPGNAFGDQFGLTVSSAGDVNNDGHDDVAIGAPTNDEFGPSTGRVAVYSGATGSELAGYLGSTFFHGFGFSIDSTGDIDNDGIADLIVGALGSAPDNPDRGVATVLSGATGATLFDIDSTPKNPVEATSVSGAGDVDNDGTNDFLAAGAVVLKVFSGATGALLHEFPVNAFDLTRMSASDAGDVNADGHDDVAIGDSFNGVVRVYSGDTGAEIVTIHDDMTRRGIGQTVSPAGDVNNDGLDDLLIGSVGGGYNDGLATVYLTVLVPLGAACFPDGSCIDGVAEFEAVALGAEYQGDGTDCGMDLCPVGAACTTDGLCLDGLARFEADALGAEYQGDGTDCSTVQCPVGAACFPDGSCLDGIAEFAAVALGGDYQGDGTDCATVTCPQPTGACCLDIDGTCIILTEAECNAISGTVWGGMDSICDGNGDGIPDGMCDIPVPCPVADTNGDGVVSPADFNGWIIAFNTQSPECDQNGDGLCTPADFNAWILNYSAGC